MLHVALVASSGSKKLEKVSSLSFFGSYLANISDIWCNFERHWAPGGSRNRIFGITIKEKRTKERPQARPANKLDFFFDFGMPNGGLGK